MPGCPRSRPFRGSTAHLKFTAYPSNPNVIIGSRFSVAIEVEPNPGHPRLCAGRRGDGLPGRLPQPPAGASRPVRGRCSFPASEIYYFEPLDERVPVYQSPFTLLQEVVIEATLEDARALRELDALTLGGTFDFQGLRRRGLLRAGLGADLVHPGPRRNST